jgi:sulfur relay (sulfurtransferase) complex TusBCD TusD component (DsrE family)
MCGDERLARTIKEGELGTLSDLTKAIVEYDRVLSF